MGERGKGRWEEKNSVRGRVEGLPYGWEGGGKGECVSGGHRGERSYMRTCTCTFKHTIIANPNNSSGTHLLLFSPPFFENSIAFHSRNLTSFESEFVFPALFRNVPAETQQIKPLDCAFSRLRIS